jgi:hypothetical protein
VQGNLIETTFSSVMVKKSHEFKIQLVVVLYRNEFPASDNILGPSPLQLELKSALSLSKAPTEMFLAFCSYKIRHVRLISFQSIETSSKL